MRLFVDTCDWERVSCTDPRALEIFKRHYSCSKNRSDAPRFVGPGEEITMLSIDGNGLFVWQKQMYRNDGQTGINCAVFRNEGVKRYGVKVQSSELILQAEEIAWRRWPGERLFTFVDANEVQSSNPGYCYQCAGWNKCGVSKKDKKIILEKYFQ